MLDEDFVKSWLPTKAGKSFARTQPIALKRVKELLASGVLPTCMPHDNIGMCACKKVEPGRDVRFYLDDDFLIAICPACDSWAIFPTHQSDVDTMESGIK